MSDDQQRAVNIFLVLFAMTESQREGILDSLHEGRRKDLMHSEDYAAIKYAWDEFVARASAKTSLVRAIEAAFPKVKP